MTVQKEKTLIFIACGLWFVSKNGENRIAKKITNNQYYLELRLKLKIVFIPLKADGYTKLGYLVNENIEDCIF